MRRKTTTSLSMALLIFGCACFSIAGFDPEIVTGAARLQHDFAVFFSGLAECAGTPDAQFERHEAFYADAWQELERLEDQARGQPANQLTLDSIDAIRDNLAALEAIHRQGISRGEVDVIATLFDSQLRMLVELENAKQRKEE
jgi:hypothetical protein